MKPRSFSVAAARLDESPWSQTRMIESLGSGAKGLRQGLFCREPPFEHGSWDVDGTRDDAVAIAVARTADVDQGRSLVNGELGGVG